MVDEIVGFVHSLLRLVENIPLLVDERLSMGQGVDEVDCHWGDCFDGLKFFNFHLVSESGPFVGDLVYEEFGVFIAGDGDYPVREY
jgi:hypothetical protein